jgi:ATP-binding cassette subfamily B protein
VYREVRQALVDMDALFSLKAQRSAVTDCVGAVALPPPREEERTVEERTVEERTATSGARSTTNGAQGHGGFTYVGGGADGADVVSGTGARVEFRDVTFGYVEGRAVLDGLSFEVAPGQRAALVGPSGCGKSTVLKLLYRFYDAVPPEGARPEGARPPPSGGAVLVNGVDVRDVKLESLRAAMAVVPQDTSLFNGSIHYNIAYGGGFFADPRTDPSAHAEQRAAVEEAARLARIDDAVRRMPQGYDTVVGERGLKLSGGEKQRVAVARAVLKRAPLMICDEATSALDSQTEEGIMECLRSVGSMGGRTSIFVAHRLSTVQDVDKIIVMDEGRVVESGTHAELLQREGGLYQDMWTRQTADA